MKQYKLEVEVTVKKTIYVKSEFYKFDENPNISEKKFIKTEEVKQLEMDAVGYMNDVILCDEPKIKMKVGVKNVQFNN